jgi:short-subunit dehydrogenase
VTPLVFITGASSGIGQALAAHYAQQGWRLALTARRADAIEQWSRAQGLGPPRCVAYASDVSQIDSIVAAGRRCIEQQGLPDVVIANAGISVGIDTAIREDLDVLAETLALNNVGLGTLVGVASVAAIRGLPGHGAYCASKAGVVAYCESLRGECRGSGVRVVTIVPGYVATPLTAGNRYGMPFLMQPDVFAERAFRAIAAGTSYRVIPWQMGVVAKLMRLLPNALFDRLLEGRGRKQRRGE